MDAGQQMMIPGQQPKRAHTLQRGEKNMLWALGVAGAIAFVAYFWVLPQVNELKALAGDIPTLRGQAADMEAQIAKLPGYENARKAAVIEREQAKRDYMSPMNPEDLGAMVNAMLVDSGFTPDTLALSTIVAEPAPGYQPSDLNPVPPGGQSASAPSGTAFVYTIGATVKGDRDKFYAFLGKVEPHVGLKIAQWSWTRGATTFDTATGKKKKAPDTFAILLKAYIYVEGAYPTPEMAAAAPMQGGGTDTRVDIVEPGTPTADGPETTPYSGAPGGTLISAPPSGNAPAGTSNGESPPAGAPGAGTGSSGTGDGVPAGTGGENAVAGGAGTGTGGENTGAGAGTGGTASAGGENDNTVTGNAAGAAAEGGAR